MRTTLVVAMGLAALVGTGISSAQLIDKTREPNAAQEGIAKSLTDQVGANRGDNITPQSSTFIIERDPFRAIRRGRQLFQRKFAQNEGLGPAGSGRVSANVAPGAGFADSCAACHGRPRGAAGFGGDVATRPDSRDAPHLFGLGLKEMLADEITADLRGRRDAALLQAHLSGRPVAVELVSKGIRFGVLTVAPDGRLDTSRVEGVDSDLRIRPFFAHGGTISIREFVVGALHAEMGLQAVDPDLTAAVSGQRVVTPAGMTLDGQQDAFEAPPTADPSADPDGDGVTNEVPTSLIDYFEFYLLNYFKPAHHAETASTRIGRQLMETARCTSCHVPDLRVERDRRVADVETAFDAVRGGFNRLFATASVQHDTIADESGHPPRKKARGGPFLVRDIFTDFKRHDLGPAFHERNYDGTTRRSFLTTPLWGVGSTPPYGHDGRSISLREVILRHGGEAQASREAFAALSDDLQNRLIDFLESLVVFPPDDTASNLAPADPSAAGYPQAGHGSIRLSALFNEPNDPE